MSKKFPGGFISKSPVAPAGSYETSAASGVWTLSQAAYWQKQGLWPVAGSVAPPTVIGQAYGGGFYAGQIGVGGVATHYIIVGPVASAQSSKAWQTSNTNATGTSSVIDGPTNSANMNTASFPAAQFCEAVSTGGQTDWYMPAKNELEICYFNLKPSTTNNQPYGINPNAIPARASNYTSGNPAQTSASSFQTGGAEVFTTDSYFSSTQYDAGQAWFQTFHHGVQYFFGYKTNSRLVRAVRRVAV
jgi:hypothetical protein